MDKEGEGIPDLLEEGERRDSEYFEEDLVDAAWIPAGYAWQSLGEQRERVNDLEDYAEWKLGAKDE